jgi:hypothetical protein|tara:strand:+ start:253 stop:516 length:264 start_codon:yes stop_codon:yes gene_type:complete
MEYDFPDSFGEFLCSSLKSWVEHGVQPGHFVTAVLTNNLFEAIARADSNNVKILQDIVQWVYSNAPSDCWGSVEKMKEWKGLENVAV